MNIGVLNGREVQALECPYARCADQDAAEPARHRVVVVGAGPVGLTPVSYTHLTLPTN